MFFGLFRKSTDDVIRNSKIASHVVDEIDTMSSTVARMNKEITELRSKVQVMYEAYEDDNQFDMMKVSHFIVTLVLAIAFLYDHFK